MSLSFGDFAEDAKDHDAPLTMSYLSNSGIDCAIEDNEIESLQTQISEYTTLLATLRGQLSDRRIRFQHELEELQKSIDETKINYDVALQQQIDEQSASLESLKNSIQDQIYKLANNTDHVSNQLDSWVDVSNNLAELRQEYNIQDLQAKIHQTEADGVEAQMTRQIKFEEIKQQRNALLIAKKSQLKALEEAVSNYSTIRREQQLHFDTLTQECMQNQTTRENGHKLIVQKLNYEDEQRNSMFESHISTLKEQIERERRRVQVEQSLLKQTEDNLQLMKKELTRKCAAQIDSASKDIEKIEKVLEQQNASGEREKTQTLSSISKFNSLQRQNVLLEQQAQQYEMEISQIQGQILSASSELKKATTPKKSSISHGLFGGTKY